MATMHPAAMPPAPAVMRILGRFDRQALASFITVAIELLDVVDGDTDTELNGDEDDGDRSEDEFMHHEGSGPGCIISDPDKAVDDDGEAIDEREPDHADLGHCTHYGIDQTRPVGERNPALV